MGTTTIVGSACLGGDAERGRLHAATSRKQRIGRGPQEASSSGPRLDLPSLRPCEGPSPSAAAIAAIAARRPPLLPASRRTEPEPEPKPEAVTAGAHGTHGAPARRWPAATGVGNCVARIAGAHASRHEDGPSHELCPVRARRAPRCSNIAPATARRSSTTIIVAAAVLLPLA